MDKKQEDEYVTIRFVKQEIKIKKEDYQNPFLALFLSQVELVEIKFGEGLLYYKQLVDNYKLKLSDPDLEMQVKRALLMNVKDKKTK